MIRKISAVIAVLAGMHCIFGQQTPKKDENKETKIEEVTITKTKKAVEQKADRTIFDFSEQPHLNSGTAMEGIKKLPGLVSTDIVGVMYQGKPLDVFLNGRPLNISSNDLIGFLEGMPANAIEKIEIITNPGAEFPATSGGAIMNIITNKNANKYLSATYSGNYTFTNYDKWRSRTNNSVSLNARNKLFGWQLRVGQNFRENRRQANQDNLINSVTDGTGRGYFATTGFTFDLGKDRLLLNYELYHNNNSNYTNSDGINVFTNPDTNENIFDYFNSYDKGQSKNLRQEASVTYQKRFDDKSQKLDFEADYTNTDYRFYQDNLHSFSSISGPQILGRLLDNSSNMNIYKFKIDYSQPLKILDEGILSIGGLYENQHFTTESKGITNLDYKRNTAASYIELKTKWKKFDFTLGTRAENYDISGKTKVEKEGIIEEENLIPFNKLKFFPNASAQYSVMDNVYFALNYNKKITLPSISALNPNNTTFQGPNTEISGNPFLQPTINDNLEVKLSAFDYAFIGYNVSIVKDQVVQYIYRDNFMIRNLQVNIPDMKVHNFNFGVPLPFMMFTKSFSEMMKFNFNPDKINFMYFYLGYVKHEIPNFETKGFWIYNVMTQVILPKDIKLVLNYNTLSRRGNFYYFQSEKPFNHTFDVTFTKKFMKDRLTLSVYANDIFNTQQTQLYSQPLVGNPVYIQNKMDTRNFGFSVNYKIPTRNKLAKEDPNILKNNQQSDSTGGISTSTP